MKVNTPLLILGLIALYGMYKQNNRGSVSHSGVDVGRNTSAPVSAIGSYNPMRFNQTV